jgi:hypothetical protein
MSGLVVSYPALKGYWRLDMEGADWIVIVVVIILALAAMFIIPQWRMRRAIPQVIRLFREGNAIGNKNAKTLDELGLRPKMGALGGLFSRRDYRQYALSALMRSGIIEMTEDEKFYLVEDQLMAAGLDRPTPRYS